MSGVSVNLDAIVTQSLIEAGASRAQLLSREPAASRLIITTPRRASGKSFEWTPEEDQFVREHVATWSDAEIGRALGRSENAVHIHRERALYLPARGKSPDEMTAEQIAEGLGIDVKSVDGLIDRGFLPGRRLPFERPYRVVKRVTLLRWLVNPMNWIYFDPLRIDTRGPRRTQHKYDAEFWQHARRLVMLARSRWQDEWLTPSQAGALHGVSHMAINNAIHEGRLSGIKWGNWHILKSEATKPGLYFVVGSGRGSPLTWTAAGDAFLLLAKAVGFSVNAIQAMMGWPNNQRVTYRRDELTRLKLVRPLIKQFDLPVDVSCSGDLFTDWKQYRKRFKALAAAMDRFRHGEVLAARDRLYVRGVLKTWALRFYHERDRAALLRRLYTASNQTDATLRELYRRMKRAGVDPYKKAKIK